MSACSYIYIYSFLPIEDHERLQEYDILDIIKKISSQFYFCRSNPIFKVENGILVIKN